MRKPQALWSFLRDNERLRGVIAELLSRPSTASVQEIGKGLGINPYHISWYLKGKTPNMTNYDLIRLCDYLGLEIDLDISFKPI